MGQNSVCRPSAAHGLAGPRTHLLAPRVSHLVSVGFRVSCHAGAALAHVFFRLLWAWYHRRPCANPTSLLMCHRARVGPEHHACRLVCEALPEWPSMLGSLSSWAWVEGQTGPDTLPNGLGSTHRENGNFLAVIVFVDSANKLFFLLVG